MTNSDAHAKMSDAECPSICDLEAHLQGDPLGENVLQHIEQCASCMQKLEEMRSINMFLASLTHDLADAIATMPPAGIPASVEGMTFLREIGRGGQGVVYEAIQEGTNRTVAVKALRYGAMVSEGQRERFRREIRLVASLNHPNIVTIHDVVDLPHEQLAYAMQCIDGEMLEDWLENIHHGSLSKPHDASAILTVFIKITRAVAYAHSQDVIHRDLKPSNVLIDAEDEPHILDFGIACTIGENVQAGEEPQDHSTGWETRTNEFVGSPLYAAPEQLTPGASVDERTDVYALGVMLRNAVNKDDRVESLKSNSGVFVDIDWIIARAVAQSPNDRYPSATSFADDLVRLMERRPIAARPGSFPYVIRRAMQRRPILLSAIAGIALLIVVSALVVVNQNNLLAVQTVEMGRADYFSSIDRANSLIDSGSFLDAEQLLWDALLTGSSDDKTDSIEADGPSLTSPALWGLRSLYAQQPCLGTFFTGIEKDKYPAQIAFDESGTLLFALSLQGRLETWDWQSASLLRSVQLTAGPILEMAFAAHSSVVAAVTQSEPHLLTLFDMTSGESVAKYDCSQLFDSLRNKGRPTITLSADASRVAIGAGHSLLLIDRINNNVIHIDLTQIETVASLDFDADAERLLIAGKKNAFELRDAEAGQLLSTTEYSQYMDQIGTVREGYFLPEDNLLMFAGDMQVVFNNTTKESHQVNWHNQVYAVRGTDTASNQVATTFANEIVVGQIGAGDKHLLKLRGHRSTIRSLALLGEKQRLASIDADGVVRIWDIAGSRPVRVIETASRTVFAVDSSIDGERIYSGDSNGALRTWRWKTATPVAGIEAQLDNMISRIAVSPDGEHIAVGTEGKGDAPELLIIELRTGRRLVDLRTLTGRVNGLAFSPDSKQLAVAAGPECLVVDLSENGQTPIRRTVRNRTIRGLDFSVDGKTIVCTDSNGVYTLDADTLMDVGPTMRLTSSPRHVAASPVDDLVVVESDDSALSVIDPSSGRRLGRLLGHSLSDHWMDFHPSGELLVSAGEDGVLKLWDIRSMRCVATFKAHGLALFCARFVPGSLRVVTGDTGGRIGLWDFGSLDQYVAGNIEAAIARHGEDDLPPERLRRLRAWAKTRLAAN